MASIGSKRSQIASLISSDLKRKHAAKTYQTSAGILKTRLQQRGRADVAGIQATGAMEREVVGQEGATYRKNIAVAGDKAIQGMRGKQAVGIQAMRGEQATGVQKLRGKQALSVQDLRGEQAEDLLEKEAYNRRWEAREAGYQAATQTATIPTMDVSEYIYNPTETGKKKKTAAEDYLLIP